MKNFTKIVFPGKFRENNRNVKVFIKITFRDDKLSLSGVEGPKRNGDCAGSCGQIEMHIDENYLNQFSYTEGWNKEKFQKLIKIWRKWHLNDMRAGCEHQRAERWEDIRIDPNDPSAKSLRHPQHDERGIVASWVRESEHPQGVLCKPCPICGYKYGTAWLKEEVPEEVLEWLMALQDASEMPAWV